MSVTCHWEREEDVDELSGVACAVVGRLQYRDETEPDDDDDLGEEQSAEAVAGLEHPRGPREVEPGQDQHHCSSTD